MRGTVQNWRETDGPDGAVSTRFGDTSQSGVIQIPAVVIEIQVQRDICGRPIAATNVDIPACIHIVAAASNWFCEATANAGVNVREVLRFLSVCRSERADTDEPEKKREMVNLHDLTPCL